MTYPKKSDDEWIEKGAALKRQAERVAAFLSLRPTHIPQQAVANAFGIKGGNLSNFKTGAAISFISEELDKQLTLAEADPAAFYATLKPRAHKGGRKKGRKFSDEEVARRSKVLQQFMARWGMRTVDMARYLHVPTAKVSTCYYNMTHRYLNDEEMEKMREFDGDMNKARNHFRGQDAYQDLPRTKLNSFHFNPEDVASLDRDLDIFNIMAVDDYHTESVLFLRRHGPYEDRLAFVRAAMKAEKIVRTSRRMDRSDYWQARHEAEALLIPYLQDKGINPRLWGNCGILESAPASIDPADVFAEADEQPILMQGDPFVSEGETVDVE